MHQNNELELIKKAQAGDRKSFDELYYRYRRQIFVFIYNMMGNVSTAEEVMQATFVRAYLNIKKYRPISSFSSWLYELARNVAKNEIRRIVRARNVSMETKTSAEEDITLGDTLKSSAPGPEEVAQKRETREEVARIIAEMPAIYREVITLCLIQEMSYKEAAMILKCSPNVVAGRLFLAKKYFLKISKEKRKR